MGGSFTLVNWGQHVNHLYTYLTLDASDHLSYLGFTERSFVFGTNLSANCKVRWVISLEKREKEESLKSNLFTLSVPSMFILNCMFTHNSKSEFLKVVITTYNFWDAMLCSLIEIYDFGGISEDVVIPKHIKNQHRNLHLHIEMILVWFQV